MPTNDDQSPRAAGASRWRRRLITGLASVATAGLAGGGLAACSAPAATAHTAQATIVAPARSAAAADVGLPRFYVVSAQAGLASVLQVRRSATGTVVPGPAHLAAHPPAHDRHRHRPGPDPGRPETGHRAHQLGGPARDDPGRDPGHRRGQKLDRPPGPAHRADLG